VKSIHDCSPVISKQLSIIYNVAATHISSSVMSASHVVYVRISAAGIVKILQS